MGPGQVHFEFRPIAPKKGPGFIGPVHVEFHPIAPQKRHFHILVLSFSTYQGMCLFNDIGLFWGTL